MRDERIGWTLFVATAIIPVIYWFLINNVSASFSSFSSTMNSLGRIASLMGIVLFSNVLLLNTRITFIEDLFNGLDKAYKAHHFFGASSFVLLLFHPILLASALIMTSTSQAALFLLPSQNIPTNLGISAILSMQLFLIFTFFIKLPYQNWKLTHKFLGLSFLLASLHVFTISSDVSRNIFLRTYIFAFIAIGFLSFIYRSVLHGMRVKKSEFEISTVKTLDETVTELTLKSTGQATQATRQAINFRPGQFVFISVQDENIGVESHPFSISSASNEESIRLSIKSLGDYTSKIKEIKPGTKAELEGPYGRFFLDEKPDQIFLAGGIGITPFLSFARSLSESARQITHQRTHLVWSVPTAKEAIFAKEIHDLSKKHEDFKFTIFNSEKQGRITGEYLLKETSYLGQDIYLCAPPGMMVAIKKQLISLGVKKEKIHMEEFAIQ